ncbi:hypothetical protein KC332_g16814 [Hortaea werneckii]|uniref:Uncharacterized protein n=2 Tax=Hortaea werneckii TaxID=91943 RepID=A0A3M7IGL2_HORWE|nr:hypothetical protein KC350_g16726 [Hortaea werneckii]OTA27791.1 hypothetical protein BTJ68_09978 [Hortaea werneckii EXF-2000]KAI6820207.1 hypothetical protein KC358_g9514 [Hortaea werneckii]KAI6900096.1 hypothetical protein KC348_g16949 [Hortaea werneckii]KAI6920095.1 hypothetical protein KC341_g16832 [Hortaea werneckii]
MQYYANTLPRPPTRTLRSILPIVWPIGFALLLAHGATQAVLLPVLGIIPMTLSSLTGLIHFRGKLDGFGLTTLLLDFFCAAFLFALLMPSWLVIARSYGYRYGAGTIMLATYGTVPLMVQLTIHLRFLLDRSSWQNLFPTTSTCPHCHNHLPTTITPRRFGFVFPRSWGDRFGEYQDLPTGGDDEAPVPSPPGGWQQQEQQQHEQKRDKEAARVSVEDKEQQQEALPDQRKRSSTSSYSSAGEGVPRPSTDDETARLV